MDSDACTCWFQYQTLQVLANSFFEEPKLVLPVNCKFQGLIRILILEIPQHCFINLCSISEWKDPESVNHFILGFKYLHSRVIKTTFYPKEMYSIHRFRKEIPGLHGKNTCIPQFEPYAGFKKLHQCLASPVYICDYIIYLYPYIAIKISDVYSDYLRRESNFLASTPQVTALCMRVCCIVCVCDCVMVIRKPTCK